MLLKYPQKNTLFPVSCFFFTRVAFTLAEVLVTLGVLGIIAAMTIPSIKKVFPDNNRVMFKKAYTTLEKAVYNVINDETNYPSSQTTGTTTTYPIQVGFNYTTATSNGTYDKFCYFLAKQLNISTGGSTSCTTQGTVANTKFATTTDGMIWYLHTASDEFTISSGSYTAKIMVDVNGIEGPNCFSDSASANYRPTGYTQCSGTTKPDTFIIGVGYDGKLQVGCSTTPTCAATTDSVALDILNNPTKNN